MWPVISLSPNFYQEPFDFVSWENEYTTPSFLLGAFGSSENLNSRFNYSTWKFAMFDVWSWPGIGTESIIFW